MLTEFQSVASLLGMKTAGLLARTWEEEMAAINLGKNKTAKILTKFFFMWVNMKVQTP
jgi:hypothetical protein